MYFPIISIGEIFKNAVLNTILGMGVVFAVLIFISLLISLLAYLPKLQKSVQKETAIEKMTETKENKKITLPDQSNLPSDDLALIAVITAAVSASTGMSESDFIVRSIRRSNVDNWNKTIEF